MVIRSISRRQLIREMVVAGTVAPIVGIAAARRGRGKSEFKICIFSKHLQWLDCSGMAQTAAELGFDGVDLTVRNKGHVLPERVEDDLPEAVEAIKRAGIDPLMMATDINDPDDPNTEKILKTASALGIKYYRLGKYRYTEDKSITSTLNDARPMIRDLAAMNKHYNIHGSYQNHAGSRYVGAPLWDLWELVKEFDPRYMGCQFDIRHATVEGGQTWPLNLRLMSKHINTLAMKDFLWQMRDNKWQTVNCPLGQGQVDYDSYLRLLKKLSVSCPVSIHYEYDLGGANHGATKLTIGKEKLFAAIRADLKFLRARLREHGLL
ncbi:MAG: sugar phosphate isomerase/epimerase [Phycisphaerae bacterium]|nr:sugar phosphate isomerase/epimerase [Phycisphaerae bacterium]